MTLIISTNEPRKPRFSERPTFYSVDYAVSGPAIARALAAQEIVDMVGFTLTALTERRLSNVEAESGVAELWRVIEEIVHRFDGASVAKQPEQPGTEAPTKQPSDSSSSSPESSSSTKQKRTRSK